MEGEFKKGSVGKGYIGLVEGRVCEDGGRVEVGLWGKGVEGGGGRVWDSIVIVFGVVRVVGLLR